MKFILEALSYKLSKENFYNGFNLSKYEKKQNGQITSYYDKKGIVFSYDNEKQRIDIIRQGWQLKDIQRNKD